MPPPSPAGKEDEITLRDFRDEDDAACVALERETAQGAAVRVAYERVRFAARARLYDGGRIHLAEGRAGRPLGVLAAAPKRLRLAGREVATVYLFDLRVRAEARREGLALRLTDRVLAEAGPAELAYVTMLADNEAVQGLRRAGFRVVGVYDVLAIPVYKPRRERASVAAIPADEARSRAAARAALPLAPDLAEVYGSPLLVGAFAAGGASAALWNPEPLFRTRVLSTPPLLRLLGPLARAAARVVRLPRVPRSGEILGTRVLFDLIAGGAEAELDAVIARASNEALRGGADVLLLPLACADPLAARLGRRAMTRARCVVGARELSPARPDVRPALDALAGQTFYVDARDI
jgi:ribosomal protein S18 acetylase RimI-like enzyme